MAPLLLIMFALSAKDRKMRSQGKEVKRVPRGWSTMTTKLESLGDGCAIAAIVR